MSIINWAEQLNNLKIDPTYKPTLPLNILDHCLPIISSLKIIKNTEGLIDSGLMLKPLKANPTGIIKTPNGNITNQEYLSMITFLGTINRSKILPSMKKSPRLGSLTPLGLYAYKLNYDIPYSAWDRDASWFGVYLGKFLLPIRDLGVVPKLTSEELLDYRLKMQTVKTTGEVKLNTAYRTALKVIKDKELPAPAVYMLLQLWIANVEFRDTSSMILDPINWDNIPESLDAIPKVGKKSGVSIREELWDIL